MAQEGELLGLGVIECLDCKAKLPLKVCRSGAGYYLGHWCDRCGPYSRETGYFGTQAEADKQLEAWHKNNKKPDTMRDTAYHEAPIEVYEIKSAEEVCQQSSGKDSDCGNCRHPECDGIVTRLEEQPPENPKP